MQIDATANSPRRARVLVVYHSETGTTRQMAELVAEGARTVADSDVRLLSIAEATAEDMLWADGIAAGSPTYIGSVSWQMKKFFDELVPDCWPEVEGKIGCAFATEGGLQGGGELACQTILMMMMNYGMLTFGVPDYVGPGRTLHYGAVCAGRPRDDADREACRRLGRRLAEWINALVLGRPDHSPRNAAYDRRV